MGTIKLTNEKKLDAAVSFEPKPMRRSVEFTLPDQSPPRNVKILKYSIDEDLSVLMERYGDDLADELTKADPEINMEKGGILLDSTRKLYVTKDHQILYGVDLYEIVRDPSGDEKSRQLYTRAQGNINVELPVQWTGKFFSKEEAIRRFVFSKKYQLRHVNGLTYDFLYEMAKTLDQKRSLMLIGAGKKGTQPLIFHAGGLPYRGFLEGRIKGETYCLILHLSNLELKELVT